MFNLKRTPRWEPPRPVIGLEPPRDVRRKAWVTLRDGRCGYVDRYQVDGKFVVRPVEFATGRHFLNPSEHWSEQDRINYPEEIALNLSDFSAASPDEIPRQYRG
jgi:hypothetical protein